MYTQPVDVSLEVLQVCGAAPCSYCVLYCTQSVDVSLEVLQVRGAALLLLLQLVNVPEDSVQLIPILRPGSTYVLLSLKTSHYNKRTSVRILYLYIYMIVL